MNPPIPSEIGRRRSGGAGFILLLFALIVWLVANQIVAQRMGYVSDLGRSFPLHLGPLHRFYWTFGVIEWALRFNGFLGRVYPPHVVAAANSAIVTGLEWGAGIAAAIILPLMFWRTLRPRKDPARGMVDSSGNWATEADVERVGLFANSGFILGGLPTLRGWRTIRYAGDAGITLTGPPGSRKTSSYLVPNLTSLLADPDADKWTEDERRIHPFGIEPSHIVLDVRGYLVRVTSGWRRAIGHKVFIFEPFSTNRRLTKINTLWSIHVGGLKMYDHCYRAAQDVIGETDGLVTSTGGANGTTYWDQACTAFKAAIIGTMAFRSLYERNPKLLSYHECVKYIDSFRSIERLLIDMQESTHDPHGIFSRYNTELFDERGRCNWIVDCVQAMANKEAEEKSGVYGTMIEKLNLFRSPVIGIHTCESTVDFKRLVNSDRPGCLYLSIPGMELTHAAPLLRVIVSHALRDVTEDGSDVRGGREVRGNVNPLVIWLDEIAAAKTIPALVTALGFLRGHGIYVATFWQGLAQLHRWYGENETLSENFQIHAFQTPNTFKAAKPWSEALGSFTRSLTKHSTSSSKGDTNSSQSADTHTRPLLTPGEVLKLPRDETVLLGFGEKIRAKTASYWLNPSALLRILYPHVSRPDNDVPEPQYHERIAAMLGRDELEALHQPLPEPEPIPEQPYKISLFEQHMLDERHENCSCPEHQPKKEAATC